MINCIEELGNDWRINHLNNKITSIELPIKHDINYAINVIRKSIENDKKKSFILVRYVTKNDEKRENIFYLSKLLLPNEIGKKYIVENFKEEIWRDADIYIIEKIISTCEKWESLPNAPISLNDLNKLLNFLYKNNNKIFDEKKLLPSINGKFNFLSKLSMEYNINEEIKTAAKNYIYLNFDDKILNNEIRINDLNINIYGIDDILTEINQFLNRNEEFERKVAISKILINFLPDLESNDGNESIIKKHKDIRDIFSKISCISLKEDILLTKINSIWESVDKYIMLDLQKNLNKRLYIPENLNINSYINVLNKYQTYFDFQNYDLIPNSNKILSKINNLEDYNDIPKDILDGIKKIFFEDLQKKSIYKGLKIKGIKKITMHDIGKLIEKLFENKIKEERKYWRYSYFKFDYKYTYPICKIIIKYIPLEGERRKYQIKLYNLYKKFDGDIEDMIEIDSYENLYSYANKGIIQYINEQIQEYGSIKDSKIFTDNIFDLINENSEFLNPNEYKIIPNQLGIFNRLDDLYRDEYTFEELKVIISEYENIKEKLMDNRIIKFTPTKIINNDYIKKKINDLIEDENEYFDIKKTLKLIPKKDVNNKQKEIKYIYEFLCNNGKPLKEINIEIEPSFWEPTNVRALEEIKKSLKSKNKLKHIDKEEEKALQILETLYKYIPPELKNNENIKMVPNQYGNLLGYNELSEEKELNQNFKKMLKNLFDYDII